MKTHAFLLVSALLLPFAAQTKTISGTRNGVSWTASNNVIGQTSTATIAGGGNPIYLAQAAKYRSTVALRMDYGAEGVFVCSGSLNGNRTSIITAAHCVKKFNRAPNKVTAYFYNGDPSDNNVYAPGAIGVTAVDISKINVSPLYTGNVVDQNDIAVLRLGGAAPAYAQGYELYTMGDLTGVDINIAGYGRRSNAGGAVGVNLGAGRLRQGDNRVDFRLGDADFGGAFTSEFFGEPAGAQMDFSYLTDFDNGLARNDASCGLATQFFGLAASPKYCNIGRGLLEASIAGGDSGGPQFVDGKLAMLTSYGLTFGTSFSPGDIDNNINSSWGEFGGYVPIFIHADFISGVVPEPATWAMMIGGFGLVGAAARRRREATVTA